MIDKICKLKDLHIRITSKCNLNCPHCYAAEWFEDNVSLEYDDLKSVILQAINLGCEKVTFTGGEPLVSNCIGDVVQLCLEHGLGIEIETNGVFLDKFISEINKNISKIEFAVSYDGEDFRNSRFTGTVIRNILRLKQLGCDVKIQTVFTKLNIKDMDNILQFSKNNGIRNRVFLAHSPTGNGKDIPLFELNEWLKIVNEIRQRYTHAIIELPELFSGGRHKKCGWGVHRCEIMPNGDVTSCAPITFNRRGFIAGNIKTDSLKTIWYSDHFKYIRSLKQKDFDTLCSNCIYWESCLGACRSISYSTNGSLLSPHPFCSALYTGMIEGKVDISLISNMELVEQWMEQQQYKTLDRNKKYIDMVLKQHKEL